MLPTLAAASSRAPTVCAYAATVIDATSAAVAPLLLTRNTAVTGKVGSRSSGRSTYVQMLVRVPPFQRTPTALELSSVIPGVEPAYAARGVPAARTAPLRSMCAIGTTDGGMSAIQRP